MADNTHPDNEAHEMAQDVFVAATNAGEHEPSTHLTSEDGDRFTNSTIAAHVDHKGTTTNNNKGGDTEILIEDKARAAAPDDDNDDTKSDRSNESMESDYYFDDAGKMHTFYRPKRRISAHSNRALKSLHANTAASALHGHKNDKEEDEEETKSVATVGGLEGNPSFAQLPSNLHDIGKEIHKLTTEDLLYISSMVSRKANREVFSVLQYSGSAWYLPFIRKVHEGEPEWEFRYEWGTGLILTLNGRRMEIHLLSYFLRAALLVLAWFIVRNAIPQYLSEPAGYIFDPVVTVLVCSLVGGFICRVLQIPPLIGCLWIGILWNNIHEVGFLTRGIYKDVRTIASRMGITVVLLRAGFSVNWQAVRPVFKNCVALIVGAFGFESMIHGFFCNYLFD